MDWCAYKILMLFVQAMFYSSCCSKWPLVILSSDAVYDNTVLVSSTLDDLYWNVVDYGYLSFWMYLFIKIIKLTYTSVSVMTWCWSFLRLYLEQKRNLSSLIWKLVMPAPVLEQRWDRRWGYAQHVVAGVKLCEPSKHHSVYFLRFVVDSYIGQCFFSLTWLELDEQKHYRLVYVYVLISNFLKMQKKWIVIMSSQNRLQKPNTTPCSLPLAKLSGHVNSFQNLELLSAVPHHFWLIKQV